MDGQINSNEGSRRTAPADNPSPSCRTFDPFSDQWSADPAEFGVCMTLIAQALGVTQPTASRHHEILRQSGFIVVRRHLKWSYCRRQEDALRDYLK